MKYLLDRFVRFNAAFCNPSWGGLALNTKAKVPLFEGLARLVLFMGKELTSPTGRPERKRVLIAVGSQNNLRSAKMALDEREDCEFASFHNFRIDGAARIPLFGQYLTGLWIVALLPILLLVERRRHVRRAMLARLDTLVLTMGNGRGIDRFIKEVQPDAVILMSVLSVYHCLVIEAAKRQNRPTIFMTHAPIGRGQPELPTDFAFLDGEFQLGLFPTSNTRMIVTGSARANALFAKYSDRSNLRGILIATNTLIRDLAEIELLARRLAERYGNFPLVLRPHPADRSRFDAHRRLAAERGMRYQDPQQPIDHDSEDCKYLIAPQSGIIVDAMMLGFFPLILKTETSSKLMESGPPDYYGFDELQVAKTIECRNPIVPDSWDYQENLVKFERAAQTGWNAKSAINAELDAVLTNRIVA